MKLIEILILVCLLAAQPSFGRSWGDPSLTLQNNNRVMSTGTSNFFLWTTRSEFDKRYSPSGKKVNLTRVFGEQSSSSSDKHAKILNYQMKMTKTLFVPQWSTSLLSGWTIGAQLPVILLEVEKTYENSDTKKNKMSRLGNVEVVSKNRLNTWKRGSFHLIEKVQFPSAQYFEEESEIQYSGEDDGYVMGLGFFVDQFVFTKWQMSLLGLYNLTLQDKIRDNNGGKNISRDPGDEILVGAKIANSVTKFFQYQFGLQYGRKNTDKYLSSTDQKNPSDSAQTLVQTEIAYLLPKKNEFENSFSTRLNYKESIGGYNSDRFSVFGVGFGVRY